MLILCKACERPVAAAPLEPFIMMGLVAPLVGLPISAAQGVVRRFGRWAWLVAGPLLLPSLLLGGLVFLAWWLVKASVWLRFLGKVCPSCGSRRWGWPVTERVSI